MGWKPSNSYWIKANADGSVKNDGYMAACRGVLRNSQDFWVAGFVRNLGACSVLMAELHGIAIILQIAWDNNIRKICVGI